jgi:hypothetical protein
LTNSTTRRSPRQSSARTAGWIIAGVLGFGILIGLLIWREQNVAEREDESKQQSADQFQRDLSTFNKLSPGQHLAKARSLLESDSSEAGGEALRHLNAIPKTAPEYREAASLENTAFARIRQANEKEAQAHEKQKRAQITDSNLVSSISSLVLFVLILCLYFIPSIIGWKKKNSGAICALNFFLGWTLVGWVVALVWALTHDEKEMVVVQYGAQPEKAPQLCSNCGRYSEGSAKFCTVCGKPFATPNTLFSEQ